MTILLGAIALGLIWALATLGVFITYRVLDIADLSMEGTIVLGASVSAVIAYNGGNPYLAILAAALAGALGGLLTGFLHTKLKIPALLSGILTMTAMYSINIRVMGKVSNVSLLRAKTIYSPLMDMGLNKNISAIVVGLLCVIIIFGLTYWFFGTEIGSAVRATGNSIPMAEAQGSNTNFTKVLGFAISNGLIGLSGGMLSQYLGFADIQMGAGAIVIGLASLIIGEVIFGAKTFSRTLVSLVLGAIAYRIIIALVFEMGMPASDLKLFTAATVGACLCLPQLKNKLSQIQNKKS
ncbi:ABC transporter permease [Tyzzerella sp. OttesenSCG-928-J15]|nr:ABC transporter permease [Tyzzerella sp. OttesenSCG-928-J15]